MWDLPGPGIEPVSPALAGGFLATAPPGKPKHNHFEGFVCGNQSSFSCISFEERNVIVLIPRLSLATHPLSCVLSNMSVASHKAAMSLAPCSSGANKKPCGVGGPEKMSAKKRVHQEKHCGCDGELPLGLQATSKSELTLMRDSGRTWAPLGGTPACLPSGGSRGEGRPLGTQATAVHLL